MANVTLVVSDFQSQFPAFALVTNDQIAMYFNMASDYISVTNYGVLRDNSRTLAIYLLTAHLLQIAGLVSTNAAIGTVTSATEGSVTVALLQPDVKSAWQFWLNQTTYGQQLLALLGTKSAFGFYVGGSQNQSNIRKADGRF